MKNSEHFNPDNIIKELIKSKFGDNSSNILEIIGATENAVIATEIACGIYKEPVIADEPSSTFYNSNKNKHNVEFVSYNKWTNRVHFKYNPVETKSIWIKKGDELPAFKDCKNYADHYWWDDTPMHKDGKSKDDYERVTIKDKPDMSKQYTNDTELSVWNGY